MCVSVNKTQRELVDQRVLEMQVMRYVQVMKSGVKVFSLVLEWIVCTLADVV